MSEKIISFIDWSTVKSRIIFAVTPLPEDRYLLSVFDRDVDETIPVYSTVLDLLAVARMVVAMDGGNAWLIGAMNYGDAVALIERREMPDGFTAREDR